MVCTESNPHKKTKAFGNPNKKKKKYPLHFCLIEAIPKILQSKADPYLNEHNDRSKGNNVGEGTKMLSRFMCPKKGLFPNKSYWNSLNMLACSTMNFNPVTSGPKVLFSLQRIALS